MKRGMTMGSEERKECKKCGQEVFNANDIWKCPECGHKNEIGKSRCPACGGIGTISLIGRKITCNNDSCRVVVFKKGDGCE